MNHRTLLSILTLIFSAALIYNILFCVFNICMNIAWSPDFDRSQSQEYSRIGQIQRAATIYHRDGYAIPVKLQLFYPDTIVQIAGELTQEAKDRESWIKENGPLNNRKWQNTWQASLNKWTNSVIPSFKTINTIDTLTTRAIVAKNNSDDWRGSDIESRYSKNVFEYVPFQSYVKSSIKIKPKTTYQHFLLFLRANLKVIFYTFLLFQLLKSVQILKSDFSVSTQLYSRINLIGWVILSYSTLQFIMDFLVEQLFNFISIESNSTGINYIDGIFIFMQGNATFLFEHFYSGLLLIIFSLLMKKAITTRKNWELTI